LQREAALIGLRGLNYAVSNEYRRRGRRLLDWLGNRCELEAFLEREKNGACDLTAISREVALVYSDHRLHIIPGT
jgi:hypothetical protein